MNAGAGAPAGPGYEAGPLQSIPTEQGGAGAWLPDLRTYFFHVTRQQFREVPLRNVLIPTLDGPVLVFEERHQPRAAVLAAQIQDQGALYRRAFDPFKRRSFANYIRRLHLRRVSLAVGYTWPGNPPGYIEFAEHPAVPLQRRES